jgi:predicted nucleic acid-binding protein
MYLVDTNIWLERLLEQDRSDEVRQFLDRIPTDQLLITDFSFHSMGVIFHRLKRRTDFLTFVQDILIDGSIALIALQPLHMQRVVELMDLYQLDFDDAYQYVAAEQYGATIVSFDNDFDTTPLGRTTPAQILAALPPEQAS